MAERPIKLVQYKDNNAIDDRVAVASTGNGWTNAFQLQPGRAYGIELWFDSDGAVDVKVEIEQGNSLPGTEGASDANYVVPGDATTIFTGVTNKTINITSLPVTVSKYARIKFTGQGSNHATTKCVKCFVTKVEA